MNKLKSYLDLHKLLITIYWLPIGFFLVAFYKHTLALIPSVYC